MTNSQPKHFLLAADIDGTLLGDETGEALLHQFIAQHTGRVTLAYITGRYRSSVLALIEHGFLPCPRFICGDVGTEMFETDFKGIIPINALDELKELARQPWHYHSPSPAARGVLDGLRHFGFM